ncbi:hypothetical protein WMY93_011823 [Mugilogobius chulae]|uniref:Uncharacterized protein n=1 Tax=Mugilogobius chulae TaxID=88201 RepID=A0AAW0P362_9GOBI
MEENPIYGNIAMQSSQTVTESETIFSSSVRRDHRRINDVSQDCYANLSLQRALPNSGPGSPVSVSPSEVDRDPEKELEEAEVRSAVSDLYASVQTRAKILQSPDSEEEYANHL